MTRLSKQIQESLGIREKPNQELFTDLLIHAIASGKDLKETYQMLLDTFGCEYTIDVDIMSKVAQQKETVILIENDRAISLWARLLGTFKEHIQNPEGTKSTRVSIPNESLYNIMSSTDELKTQHVLSSKYKSAFSRARGCINKALPKGTVLLHSVHKEDTEFTFVSASSKEEAHRLLVHIGVNSTNTMDKVLAQLGIHEETL